MSTEYMLFSQASYRVYWTQGLFRIFSPLPILPAEDHAGSQLRITLFIEYFVRRFELLLRSGTSPYLIRGPLRLTAITSHHIQ